MDAKELKQVLKDIADEFGLESSWLSPAERDFLTGRLDYTGYMQRCYADYSKGKLKKQRRPSKR